MSLHSMMALVIKNVLHSMKLLLTGLPMPNNNEYVYFLVIFMVKLSIVCRLLSENPELVNVKDDDHYTPLHRAAYSGHIDVVRKLITQGADVHARTIDGWTPLHSACKWNNAEIASFLLQNNADVNAQTNGLHTALHLASGSKDTKEAIELLLMNRYINSDLKNNLGETAFDVACRTNVYYYLFEITEHCTNSVPEPK